MLNSSAEQHQESVLAMYFHMKGHVPFSCREGHTGLKYVVGRKDDISGFLGTVMRSLKQKPLISCII